MALEAVPGRRAEQEEALLPWIERTASRLCKGQGVHCSALLHVLVCLVFVLLSCLPSASTLPIIVFSYMSLKHDGRTVCKVDALVLGARVYSNHRSHRGGVTSFPKDGTTSNAPSG